MVMFVLTKFKFSSKITILGRLATTISLRAYFSVETAGGDVYKSNWYYIKKCVNLLRFV